MNAVPCATLSSLRHKDATCFVKISGVDVVEVGKAEGGAESVNRTHDTRIFSNLTRWRKLNDGNPGFWVDVSEL